MGINLKGRSFLTLRDYSAEEIEYLVDLAIDLKEKKKKGKWGYWDEIHIEQDDL